MAETLADDILLNLQILVNEIRSIGKIGHDAPHMGGSEHHRIGLLLIEECLDCHTIEQVELGMRTPHQIGIATLEQIVPNGRAHQATVSSHINLGLFV